MLRLLVLIFVPLSLAFAEEAPAPTATPDTAAASPTPAAEASTTPVPQTIAIPAATPTPDAAATPEASPSASPDATPPVAPEPLPSPSPDATPAAPKEDVIPLPEGAKTDVGAPLETQDIAKPDTSLTDPNQIVPDGPPLPPGAPTVRENPEESDRKEAIRYREVRVQADKDPKVLSLWKQSEKAKTDEDKRAALREYYKLLFVKMISIDPALEKRCKLMEDAYIRRLAQSRLEPTIPLNPPPTPKPLDE